MNTKVIPLSDLQADPGGVLQRCYDSGETLVVELPDRGPISIRAVEEDDDLVNQLIEQNPACRELLAKSIASPRETFPFESLQEPGHRSFSALSFVVTQQPTHGARHGDKR